MNAVMGPELSAGTGQISWKTLSAAETLVWGLCFLRAQLLRPAQNPPIREPSLRTQRVLSGFESDRPMGSTLSPCEGGSTIRSQRV